VKFGIKVGAMLSSMVLALVCFVGCNSDEATPPAGGTGGGATAGAAKPGPATTTPPSTTKPGEEKK
jgi:hypothetical protein